MLLSRSKNDGVFLNDNVNDVVVCSICVMWMRDEARGQGSFGAACLLSTPLELISVSENKRKLK